MKTKTTTALIALLTTLAAGCGSTVTSQGNDPEMVPADESTVPENAEPRHIFVAARSGDDGNDGSAAAPLQSINAALRLAAREEADEVSLLSDGELEGLYTDVVLLVEGVDLRGGYCMPSPGGSVTHDPMACPAVLGGGSPALVALDIDQPTTVSDVSIQGQAAVQNNPNGPNGSFFNVPGLGCMGRGVRDAQTAETLTPCAPATDEDGRSLPLSSVGVVIHESTGVAMTSVVVESKDGASGLSGDAGVDGSDGDVGNDGGDAVPGSTFQAGAGATAPGVAACDATIARGGAGGLGGRFHWDGTMTCTDPGQTDINKCPTQFLEYNMSWGSTLPGQNGEATFGAAAGTGASFEIAERGGSGRDGGDANSGQTGTTGTDGDGEWIDPVSFVSPAGARGQDGEPGHGGAGGGGGAPAIRTAWRRINTGLTSYLAIDAVIGSADGANSTASTSNVMWSDGETAAGGGASGGNGGCGGTGGQAGQGGAASIGIFLSRSELAVTASTLRTGRGGNGAVGGVGGSGGYGAAGGQGGAGAVTFAESVEGELVESTTVGAGATGIGYGEWQNTSGQSTSSGKSASHAGDGGNGGRGGDGGAGGIGGGGAGGWSIGILSADGSTAVTSGTVTFELGAAGSGAGAANDGVQAEQTTL